MPDALDPPAPIREALQTVNARRLAEWDGANERSWFQMWANERGRVLVQIYRDGDGVAVWRPLDESNSMAATVDALQAYLSAPPPEWPSYRAGPKDCIFALGMVSVNYARLELAVHGMFAVILGITGDVSSRLMFKISPEMRDKLMREMLPTRDWPPDVSELAKHFVEAHKICYENRNKLIHSNLISGSEQAIFLYKINRDGKPTLVRPVIDELRQVADDMMVYNDYGRHLANKINFDVMGANRQAGDLSFPSWPDKPPLPVALEYTSDPPQHGRCA